MICRKSIILSDHEASQAAKLKIGETLILVRPWKCSSVVCRGKSDIICYDCRPSEFKYHPGDTLACKERWGKYENKIWIGDKKRGKLELRACNPARSMPIEHARTFLKVQDVKVEKVIGEIPRKYLTDNYDGCITLWNRRYPKHKWTQDLLVCVITAEKVSGK